ncbi:hypothetical protein PFISCL1PPCAC_1913, partial [Pristionchus fissidentatus]
GRSSAMLNGESEAGFEDYVNMGLMGQPANVATRRTSRHSGIDDPMPFQPDAVRMRNNNGEDEQIYEICYDYKARHHDELDLRRGSIVKVVKDAENGWYQGLVDGKVGVFPKNYIRAIGPCNFQKIIPDEIKNPSLIGEGAAGEVFRATYRNKAVAFKRFKLIGRERERGEDVIEKTIYNVKREAAHFSNFRHENIVELYGVCLDPPSRSFGLVLQLCQGGTLSQVYRKVTDAAVPKRILVDWAQQICAAMEAISGQFVHRDLKMDNVLVLQKVCFCALPSEKLMPDRLNSELYNHENIQPNGVCRTCDGTAFDRLKLKMTDFGLTRENSVTSRQSVAAGTSAWIAPEAYQKSIYSEYSDVWSFGVVLWELVTRKQPYESDVRQENFAMIPFYVATGLIKLETTKEFPTAIATIIRQCLEMEPEKRPKFTEIRKMLNAYMEDLLRVDDPAEYIEQLKIEDSLRRDMKALKVAGAFDDQLKFFETELKNYTANAVPEPVERNPTHKKVDKSKIGVPTAPRLLIHLSHGGTLPRNLDLLDSKVFTDIWNHPPLKPTLSKSQPNLNQIHISPQTKMSRDRHHGMRKKKEKIIDETAGYDEYLRESTSNYDDRDSVGIPFSQSQDDRPHSSMYTGAEEKRGSDGSCTFKGCRSSKEGHSKIDKIKKFFLGKKENRSSVPRHSSVSVESSEEHDNSVTPSRSQSMSSTITSSALLYNSTRTPVDVGIMYGHQEQRKHQISGKSPDGRSTNGVADQIEERRRKNILPTHNTKTYTKISPMPHPSSSPAGMSNASYSPSVNGISATNSAYSTLSSTTGNSRPSGLSQQQPLYNQGSSSSSSNSNTPVGLDEQYPIGGGGVPDVAYTHLQPSYASGLARLPPELPPRRRHGEHFHPGLSTIVPVEQSSPTHMDLSTLPSTIRGRSRTVSGCTADSPVGCVTSTPYIEMPSTAAVVVNGGFVRGGARRDSSPDFIDNRGYEPYRRVDRRLDSPCSPPLSDPPPLPPTLPPKTHHNVATTPAAAEYLTLSSK